MERRVASLRLRGEGVPPRPAVRLRRPDARSGTPSHPAPDDGKRYELFDGELLVTPAPNGLHQLAVSMLGEALLPYLMPSLPPNRQDWSGFPDPILVIEVLSASTARFDRIVKRRRFQPAGIPEYWVVDLDARAVERRRPPDERPEILDAAITWQPVDAAEALAFDLPKFFAGVWGT